MSRLNSKLVLKAENGDFTIVKSVNTLEHGVPGDILDRTEVDKILLKAEGRNGQRGTLTVEFIK